MSKRSKTSYKRKARSSKRRQPSKRKHFTAPRTGEQFYALPERQQEQWVRVTQVISQMRDGTSMRQASRELGVAPRIVTRYGASALKKSKSGHYMAKPKDSLLRVLLLPSPKGLIEVSVRKSEEATVIGTYWSAVEKLLVRGDSSALERIHRKTVVDVSGKRVRLLFDLDELKRQASAGVLHFESIYGRKT